MKLLRELRIVRVFCGLLLANPVSWLPVIVVSLVSVISGDILLVPDQVHTVTVMMQVATYPIVEIAPLKNLRDQFTAFLSHFCGKKSTTRLNVCCCHGDDVFSCCTCGLLAVVNAAILKRDSSNFTPNQL